MLEAKLFPRKLISLQFIFYLFFIPCYVGFGFNSVSAMAKSYGWSGPQHCFTYKKMRAQRRLVIQGRAPHYQHKAMRVYKLIRLRAKSLLGECETVFMRSGVADPGFLSEFFHPGSRIKKAPDPGSVQRFENSYETFWQYLILY